MNDCSRPGCGRRLPLCSRQRSAFSFVILQPQGRALRPPHLPPSIESSSSLSRQPWASLTQRLAVPPPDLA